MTVLKVEKQNDFTSWETQWPSWWVNLITSLVNQVGGWETWNKLDVQQDLDLINEALKPYNGVYISEASLLTFETEQDKMFFILKYS